MPSGALAPFAPSARRFFAPYFFDIVVTKPIERNHHDVMFLLLLGAIRAVVDGDDWCYFLRA